MRRREFITALGGAVVWPRAVIAQSTDQVRRVALLWGLAANDPIWNAQFALLKQSLRQLGWVEGRDIVFEVRHAVGDFERFPAMAVELVERKPHVIVVPTASLVANMRQATRTIPIVSASAGELLGTGLIGSLRRPGGNVTGIQILSAELMSKRVGLLKELVPKLTRLGVLTAFSHAVFENSGYLNAVTSAASALQVEVHRLEIKAPNEIASAFATMAQNDDGAALVIGSSLTLAHRNEVILSAASNRLPTIYELRHFVTSGGLMSYGPDTVQLTQEVANFVHKILKGTAPGDLPVQQPTKFELAINLKTAKVLGLNIQEALIARADEVIE